MNITLSLNEEKLQNYAQKVLHDILNLETGSWDNEPVRALIRQAIIQEINALDMRAMVRDIILILAPRLLEDAVGDRLRRITKEQLRKMENAGELDLK